MTKAKLHWLQGTPFHARRHEETLWAVADKLGANMDAAEYEHLVLGLIFVKYISGKRSTNPRRATAS